MQEEKIEILGVRFNNVSLEEAADRAIKLAKGNSKTYITTPNPEILLEAIKNPKFFEVLNKSALNVPDGIGILWASKYLSKRKVLKERVTGIDLMLEICKKSGAENLKIFLLGASETAGEKAKQHLQEKYPDIKIVGRLSKSPKEEDEKEITEEISRSGADILFVAYGAPKQELWIAKNLQKLSSVKLAIGVGGAFDFIAGTKKRAPKIFRKIGLEWLIRLIQEPKRIKRIWNATIKFPYEIIKRRK
ncbi:WecB/TagA/CpsF family glycosyltransferase [Candidatus Gracilibacteria bacterium]|jgi:N-acetylglucosaminyldiphosphoundecaprenol N-acetyl-beta-D-mannosaminyltransferase|nr:WecB/TagA/CpsF family glycosyltransferase [Candidatus Gracilibacteria bacterium]